jgi:hypothetical protein
MDAFDYFVVFVMLAIVCTWAYFMVYMTYYNTYTLNFKVNQITYSHTPPPDQHYATIACNLQGQIPECVTIWNDNKPTYNISIGWTCTFNMTGGRLDNYSCTK